MLCPKCGREYTGDECPYCSGPKILFNENDYKKRKMAYERKQARDKSAFSRTQEHQKENDHNQLIDNVKAGSIKGIQIVSGKAKKIQDNIKKTPKSGKNNQQKKKDSPEQIQQNGIEYTTRKAGKGDSMNHNKKGLSGFFVRNRKKLLALLIVLIVGGLSALGIYRLVSRKNYVLYMTSNDRIYNVAELESSFVCDNSQAVFNVNHNAFYTPNFPEEIDQSKIKDKMASDNGKYFACTIYDEDSALYTLYVWNGTNTFKVLESKKEKSIKYVSDKGKVIFTDHNLVSVEFAVTDVDYYIYDCSDLKNSQNNTGKLTLFAQDLKETKLYSDKNIIICLDNNYQLYLYDYKEMKKISVDVGVSRIYGMSSDIDGVYANKVDFVNTASGLDTFFYSTEGGCYYYNITDNTTRLVYGDTTNQTLFILEKNSQLYMIQSGNIYYATVTSDKISKFTQIDTIGKSKSIITRAGAVFYINADGILNSANKGQVKLVISGVTDGTLAEVENTTESFTYWKDGKQFYQNNQSAQPVEMVEAFQVKDTDATDDEKEDKILKQVILYKNKLYYYDNNAKLHSCTVKGKEEQLIGDVDRFWLGTELK